MSRIRQLDVLVIGGGVAGLWVLNRLARAGFATALVEQDRLGGGQSLASQGMIHGGIKYALGGRLTRASEAIADMPARWRACARGEGEIDLTAARRLSDGYWMWSGDAPGGRLAALLASRALRGRVTPVAVADRPAFFATPEFRGALYALPDFVFDMPSLLDALAAPQRGLLLQVPETGRRLRRSGRRFHLELDDLLLDAGAVVLAAGAGNADLLHGLGADAPRMQRRPLHQVCVETAHPHPLQAHCITGIRRPEPRLTVTSHPRGAGAWTWYLGGALASDGVELERAAQIDRARTELGALLPWMDLGDARFRTLRVDRAEPEQRRGGRPDEAFLHANDGVLTAWPTKLSLAPHLGDRVLAALGRADAGAAGRSAALIEALADARRPPLGVPFTELAA